jgi:hypothetical protein
LNSSLGNVLSWRGLCLAKYNKESNQPTSLASTPE